MRSVKAIVQKAAGASGAIALWRAPGREELAFLPAALEIVETPPSPIGRAIGATIIAVFCAALAWASVGRLDIVATATGKVVPSGHSKIIQPFETGVVRAIDVQDGQSVKVGDPLIELDATLNQADRDHQMNDLMATQIEIARLRAALDGGSDPVARFDPPQDADQALVTTQRQLLIDQTAEQNAKLAALGHQQAQKDAERLTAAATIDKLRSMMPMQQQKTDIYRQLYQKGYVSKLQYLSANSDLVEQQKQLAIEQSHYQEAEQALAAITQTRNQTVAEYRRLVSDQLATAEAKAAGIAQDLVKAEQRTKLQLLTAPVDGVVQQLAVHTVGGVVTPAQALMVVVPQDSNLEIEAMVANRDIGFVFPGQEVEIKVDAFDFTRYGLLHGQVLNVSSDAITRNDPPDPRSDAAPQPTSEPTGRKLDYAARISIDRPRLRVDDRIVNLSPGMAVTAEIKTGSRRIIDYLLSPLLRLRQDSLKER